MLGTASAMPVSDRNPSAQALCVRGRFFLVDCGEGAQRAMVRYGFPLQRINSPGTGIGNQKFILFLLPGEHLGELVGECGCAFAGLSRDADNVFTVGQNTEIEIAFVEHAKTGSFLSAELPYQRINNLCLLFPFRIRNIDHMEQDVSVAQFF